MIVGWRGGSVDSVEPAEISSESQRVLVLANQTVAAVELLNELRSIDQAGHAQYFVCVPANPVDTGVAELTGAVWVQEATLAAAGKRLEYTLAALRADGLTAEGGIGDFLPLRALGHAVAALNPHRLVIATHPQEYSPWLHHDVVERARRGKRFPLSSFRWRLLRLRFLDMRADRWRFHGRLATRLIIQL